MTEKDYMACNEPTKLIECVHKLTSPRKLRLFACAHCRHLWDLLSEDCFRAAVEVAERHADGLASNKDLSIAKKESGIALERNGLKGVIGRSYSALGAAWSTTRDAATAAIYPTWVFTEDDDKKRQRALCLDIFGNPFRPSIVDRGWLAWNDGTVPKIAQAIYDDRCFADMPILADALEEAGCTNADILDHCRQPGEHVRGCWVVDLLLGKS
jgi:hypothetical protein